MSSITFYCANGDCFHTNRIEGPPWPAEWPCAKCNSPQPIAATPRDGGTETISPCRICGTNALFSQKDLDQRIGCALLGAGIALALLLWWKVSVFLFVPTLLAFWLLDRLFRRIVPEVVICYKCDAEFRGFSGAEEVRPYDAHVGERYSEGRFERGKL